MWPKKPAPHTGEILTGRTIMQFSHMCVAPWHFNGFFLTWKCQPMSSPHISTKSLQVFPRYEPSKIGLVSFFFLLFVKMWKLLYKTQMHYPIPLKFGGGIKAHPDTKFDCNTINGHKVITFFHKLLTCCHAYRVNH